MRGTVAEAKKEQEYERRGNYIKTEAKHYHFLHSLAAAGGWVCLRASPIPCGHNATGNSGEETHYVSHKPHISPGTGN